MKTLTAYAAIRETGDVEWIDIDTISGHPSTARKITEKDAVKMPEWVESNPVKRIVEVEIKEVQTA